MGDKPPDSPEPDPEPVGGRGDACEFIASTTSAHWYQRCTLNEDNGTVNGVSSRRHGIQKAIHSRQFFDEAFDAGSEVDREEYCSFITVQQ